MATSYYGSIDLTELGNVVRKQPSLVREVQMKSGETHKFVNIDIYCKDEPDGFGNSASVKVGCKKDDRMDGVKYFIGNLKASKYGDEQAQPQPQPQSNEHDGGLPF